MPLEDYRAKRDFDRTPEPAIGEAAAPAGVGGPKAGSKGRTLEEVAADPGRVDSKREERAASRPRLDPSRLAKARRALLADGRSDFATLQQACRFALEGVVSKRRDRPYRPGRSRDWLKTKCLDRQELVIVGFTEPPGSRAGLGALLLGVHDEAGRLRSPGKVGTGLTAAALRDLRRRLEPLERPGPAVVDPPRGTRSRGVHWVEPELVAEIEHTGWTRGGALRHPTFRGLREDKDPAVVVRE